MNSSPENEFLTTKELAALLRIKERKVYDLAASGAIPCSRAMGKLLFARDAIDHWLSNNSSGLTVNVSTSQRPDVFLGSHDPLLEWALRESRCGLATYFDGSFDGLKRFSAGEGVAAGLHILERRSQRWNVETVETSSSVSGAVLIEWAWRERGLIVRSESRERLSTLKDLRGSRVVARQPEAGSQALLDHYLLEAGVDAKDVIFTEPVRSETDAALAVLEEKAEAAFGLPSLAAQFHLDFISVTRERFDLLVDRRSWFEPPIQAFLKFCRTSAFSKRASELLGYDVSGFGTVHFNSA
jgi:excisionase family DNA binding protein